MPIRISNLRLRVEEPESVLPGRLAQVLGLPPGAVNQWRILRKSLDARDKDALQFVYSAEVRVAEDESRLVQQAQRKAHPAARVELYCEPPFEMPRPGERPLAHRPVVVGSGPGGLVAAYFLAEQGYRPLVLERGRPVNERIRDVRAFDAGGPLDPESNYLFGEGGAGTFSDGKLTYRGSGPDVRRVLELFAECKGKPSILYEYRPHLGSNRLPAVVKALRRRIEAMGGEVHFNCRVEDLDLADGRLRGLVTSSGYVPATVAVLAIGHSARDTYAMLLRRGVPLVPKPFQMGLRIEHPQELVNRVQYGPSPLEVRLGAADYSLVARGRHDLFTFCMCAGGHVIPSVSEPGHFCTNGMSLSKRASPFANSGLVVTVPVEYFGGTDPLAGVRLQQVYERRAYELGRGEYLCPIQRAPDFMEQRQGHRLSAGATRGVPPSSYKRGVVLAEVAELVPPLVLEALFHGLPIMDRRWQGRFLPDATLVGPEARGSSPVRIVREDVSRQTPGIEGLYPVGEGAGYAGGIVSAAVDGLRTAKAIVARYAPLEK
ncbi:MAG TPA: FAD-dependent oxidoreductase [Gemmataceae bacterium]|nr:FAD-dependent oxidoreductase [Gemmataceae bacterium]